jgi:hypothetical protein
MYNNVPKKSIVSTNHAQKHANDLKVGSGV